MTTTAITFNAETRNVQRASDKSCYDYKEPAWNRYHFLAIFGFGGGAIAALLGLLCTIVAWFGATEAYATLSFVATSLVVAAMPLLILGAHALDKIDDFIDEHNKLQTERRCLNDQDKI